VPSFSPDARYLNPFDDTKASVLICNASSRGWYGGLEYPSEALRKQFENNLSVLNFDPITQEFTTSLAPEYKNTITRSASRPSCARPAVLQFSCMVRFFRPCL
jgi:hypothetical protein